MDTRSQCYTRLNSRTTGPRRPSSGELEKARPGSSSMRSKDCPESALIEPRPRNQFHLDTELRYIWPDPFREEKPRQEGEKIGRRERRSERYSYEHRS